VPCVSCPPWIAFPPMTLAGGEGPQRNFSIAWVVADVCVARLPVSVPAGQAVAAGCGRQRCPQTSAVPRYQADEKGVEVGRGPRVEVCRVRPSPVYRTQPGRVSPGVAGAAGVR
jgi:hypothetical protein